MRSFILLLFLLSVVSSPAETVKQDRPNVLWIMVDDMNDWMNCYGYDLVKTPHINSLAENGVLFNKAFVPSPVCSTTRSAIMTGSLQTTYGVHHHRSGRTYDINLPKGVKPLAQLVKESGYLTFNTRKDDYNFAHKRADLYNPEFQKYHKNAGKKRKGGGALKAESYDWFKHLKGKKFFGQIQLAGGKVGGETGSRYPQKSLVAANDVEVPPYYPDTAMIRNGIARHYEQIKLVDDEVGSIIKSLKEFGLYENTVLIFFTDHGYPMPRSKQFLYETGIKVPLVIQWPKNPKYLEAKGKVRNDIVNCIDLAAVTLKLTGNEVPEFMEAEDFFDPNYKEKKFTIAARDRCGIAVDRIRAVRTEKFKYLKNFKTDRPMLQAQYRDKYASILHLKKLNKDSALNKPQNWGFTRRVAEELYDLENDPHEINNLAKDPQYKEQLQKHRDILNNWIKQTDDKGQYPESREGLFEVFDQHGKKCVAPEFDIFRK